MNKQSKKGFTLIELLVVIAIVGILSGLLIVSMSGATNSAKDARIKANLDEMRTVVQIFSTNNPTYGFGTIANITACTNTANTFLTTGSDAMNLCTEITSSTLAPSGGLYINSSATAYCIQKTINVSGSWCVDSTGYSGATATCGGAGGGAADYACQ